MHFWDEGLLGGWHESPLQDLNYSEDWNTVVEKKLNKPKTSERIHIIGKRTVETTLKFRAMEWLEWVFISRLDALRTTWLNS